MKYLLYSGYVWLAVFVLGVTQINAQVICNFPPDNDFCRDAYEVDGELLGITCCGEIEGFNLCGSLETGVWYYYDQNLSATNVEVENLNISGGIGVEIYAGSCNNLSLLDQSDCSGFTSREFLVPNCNGRIYIHISTTNDGCGDFVIRAYDIQGCDYADECDDISAAQTLAPISDDVQVCANSCLDYSCESTCTDQSVWFRFDTDNFATTAQIKIEGAGFDPLVSIFRGTNCADFDDIVICEPVSIDEFLELAVTPDATYFVEVSSGNGQSGNFDICINTIQDFIDCSQGNVNVTRLDYPAADPNGPYCPGERVLICYDLTFNVDLPNEGNGCQWLQGVVPVLGGGWDLNAQDLPSQIPPGWGWFDDVGYNVDSPVLGISQDQQGNNILEYGPGGLSENDILPGGWFFVSNGNNCINDGHPDNGWGVQSPCGMPIQFSHCFELTTKSHTEIANCEDDYSKDLSITFFNFADGETGCYTSLACSGDTPVKFEAFIDCSTLVDLEVANDEICSGEFAEVPVSIAGGYEFPLKVTVVDAGNTTGAQDWIFESGSGLIPDQIINMGNAVETITYEVTFNDPISACPPPVETFQVRVHPEFTIDVETPIIICRGESAELTPPTGHDRYEWFNATTNEYISDTEILTIDSAGFFRVEVTEDFCTAFEIIEVQVIEPLDRAIDERPIELCNNDIGTLSTSFDLTSLEINGVNGNWTDDQGLALADPSNIEFAGQTPGIYEYNFTTDAATDPCQDTTYLVQVNVIECVCPDVSINAPGDFCNVTTSFNLNALKVTTEPGSWSVSNGPDTGSVDIQGDDLSINASSVPGLYTLRFTLSGSNIGPLCDVFSEVDFTIQEEPSAQITPAGTACNIDTGTDPDFIDLDDFNTSQTPGVWSTNEVGISIDADNVVSFVGQDVKDYVFTFTTSTAVTPCVDQEYQTLITINDCSCPSVEINPLANLCIADESFNLDDLKVTTEPGNWSVVSGPDPTSIGLLGSQMTISTLTQPGIYTVQFELIDQNIGPDCEVASTFEFEIIAPPVATILPQMSACNVFTGTDPDFIDLDDLNTSGASGVWTSDNPMLSVGQDNVVNFAGETPGDYSFTFTTNNAISPCDEVVYNSIITVRDCSCPALVISQIGDFCQEDQQFDLSTLIVNAEPGDWSISGAVNNSAPEVQNGMLMISESNDEASYLLTYTLTDQSGPPNCDVLVNLDFDIFAPPAAEILPTFELCNQDLGTLSTTLDLDDLFVSGSTGEWLSTSGSISLDADNRIDVTGLSGGDYEFVYTTNTATSPCTEVSYSAFVTVNECVCPELDILPLDDLCAINDSVDLLAILNTAEPGTWSVENQNTGNSLEIFNNEKLVIREDSEAGPYVLTYTLAATSIPPACPTEQSIGFNLSATPEADVNTAFLACNISNSPAAPSVIDLDDMVISGDPGEWVSMDTNLSVDSDNRVDFDGMDVGTYSFEYTTNTAQAPCADQVYTLLVNVEDCTCPLLSFGLSPDLCNDDAPLDLNDILLNGVAPGSWSQVDGPDVIALGSGSIFDVLGITEGDYTFRYTLTETVVAGCEQFGDIVISVNRAPELSVEPSTDVCNQMSTIAPICINLNDFKNGDDGSWTAPLNYMGDFSDVNNICFDGTNANDIYVFTFTTNTASAPCVNISQSIEVNILDCSCPNLNLDIPPALCNGGDQINLSDLEFPETVDGSWSLINGPEVVTIGNTEVFDATGITGGVYSFLFTPAVTPDPFCPQDASIEIEVIAPLSAGVGNTINYCENASQVVDLVSLLDNADAGGTWSEVSSRFSTPGLFDPVNATFDIETEIPGTYEFEYSFDMFAPCPESTALVTVIILENPTADAGLDNELNCSNMEIVLGGDNLSDGARIEYMWTEANGLPIDNPTSKNPVIYQPGIYTVTVRDNLFGCEDIDEVIVTEDIGFPTFDAEVLPYDCEGPSLGTIVVLNSTGGNGDYIYSIDGGGSWTEETVFDNLQPGEYEIILQDGNGCEAIVNGLTINEKVNLNLWAGEDIEITYGDNYYPLQASTDALPTEIDSVIWTENDMIICAGTYDECSIIEVDPTDVTNYCVTVVDVNGCSETDCVIIREILEVNVYIPNVFTPGQSNFNNRFFVQADENIIAVKRFIVMDRWGTPLFEGEEDHEPNDPSYGWDGIFKNMIVSTGVYTYHIVVEDALGETHQFGGDITIIR